MPTYLILREKIVPTPSGSRSPPLPSRTLALSYTVLVIPTQHGHHYASNRVDARTIYAHIVDCSKGVLSKTGMEERCFKIWDTFTTQNSSEIVDVDSRVVDTQNGITQLSLNEWITYENALDFSTSSNEDMQKDADLVTEHGLLGSPTQESMGEKIELLRLGVDVLVGCMRVRWWDTPSASGQRTSFGFEVALRRHRSGLSVIAKYRPGGDWYKLDKTTTLSKRYLRYRKRWWDPNSWRGINLNQGVRGPIRSYRTLVCVLLICSGGQRAFIDISYLRVVRRLFSDDPSIMHNLVLKMFKSGMRRRNRDKGWTTTRPSEGISSHAQPSSSCVDASHAGFV
ncbi:hypothetical protein FB446DRAFT_773656 [Lentinula raphanica]|nr:hypothetical protein FB446DRAFT_773656 [Lentinula raphanica]